MMNDPNTAYYSKEVRWFFPENPESIKLWFAENKFSFDGDQCRIDHYLDMRPQKNISWKIREGRTEIKLQLGGDTVLSFPNNHSGIVNRWVKWSLPLKMKIERPDILYDMDEKSFISIKKKRVLVTFEVHPDGTISVVNTNAFPLEGCQVELTEIICNNLLWYSLGFEALGTESMLDQNFDLVTGKVLGEIMHPVLNEAISMSYPAFLASVNTMST